MDRWTRSMVWRDWEMVSKPDYLLASKHWTFSNVAVMDTFQNSDHFMDLV